MNRLPSLNGKEIYELHPKSMAAASKWFSFLMEEREMTKEQIKTALEAVITWSPRSLYDFLDENGVQLVIGKVDDRWSYHIVGDLHSSSSETRKEAEEKGFEVAFKLLEEKL